MEDLPGAYRKPWMPTAWMQVSDAHCLRLWLVRYRASVHPITSLLLCHLCIAGPLFLDSICSAGPLPVFPNRSIGLSSFSCRKQVSLYTYALPHLVLANGRRPALFSVAIFLGIFPHIRIILNLFATKYQPYHLAVYTCQQCLDIQAPPGIDHTMQGALKTARKMWLSKSKASLHSCMTWFPQGHTNGNPTCLPHAPP